MKIEDAIQTLKGSRDCAKEHGFDVYDYVLAISALEKQLNGGWIPVSERLPQNNEHILLFLKDEKGKTAQVVGYLYHSDNENFKNLNGEFKSFDGDDLAPNFLNKECVVAWQLLPEPYKEVEH